MRKILAFQAELQSIMPGTDLEADKCEGEWDIAIANVEKYIADITAWGTESEEKATEYTESVTELTESIKSSYPCENGYVCTFGGKLSAEFAGNKLRKVCVSEESAAHGEEACRFEEVKGFDNQGIVRAHDDSKYFCYRDQPLFVDDKPEGTSDLDDTGELTDEGKKKQYDITPEDDKLKEM